MKFGSFVFFSLFFFQERKRKSDREFKLLRKMKLLILKLRIRYASKYVRNCSHRGPTIWHQNPKAYRNGTSNSKEILIRNRKIEEHFLLKTKKK